MVFSKYVSGALSDATFGKPNTDGVRKPVLQKGELAVDKELGPDFFLVIKHPALFPALLPTLVGRFPCYAVVRNPLAVLASRSSLGRDSGPAGKLPKVLRMYDEEIRREIGSMTGDVIEVRLRTLSWACERYIQYLPQENVIRYEDSVASRIKALSTLIPAAGELDEPLKSRNLNELYDREKMLRIGEGCLGARELTGASTPERASRSY